MLFLVTPIKVTSREAATDDDSEEEVRSDDEFCFVEDSQTLNGMQISSVGTGTSSARFDELQESVSRSSVASSVKSEEFVGKSQFRVDDFARMLSEFKGFGTLPSGASVDEPPRIPVVVSNEKNRSVSREVEGNLTEGDEPTGNASAMNDETSGSECDAEVFLAEEESVGEQVKSDELQEGPQGITSRESVQETENHSENQLTSVVNRIPSYLEVVNDSKVPTRTAEASKPQDPIYDSPRQDDSYSLFERSQERASQVAGGTLSGKVENLKPRLPFPVLLVSAGEGYADLRRKRPNENDKEPRIMIWQIS